MLQTQHIPIPEASYQKLATLYTSTVASPKACILYFHGGGLLYGSREDLPQLHKELVSRAGYAILAFDYPLAPAANLDVITEDIRTSVDWYLAHGQDILGKQLPYFLWGRSAGAYLCLQAAAKGNLSLPPKGLVSYYGYGFLCDGWFLTPSKYYRSLPPVGEEVLRTLPEAIHAQGPLDTHYGVYVYARRTGKWLDLIYKGRTKFFYLDHTLRLCDSLPCPVFCTHSTGDTDVPYEEFLELCSRYRAQRFVASANMHDFDRDEANPVTTRLLEATVKFLDQRLA